MTERLKTGGLLTSFTLLCAATYALAFALRFGGPVPSAYHQVLLVTLGFAVVAKMSALLWHGVHQQHQRYASFEDLMAIAKAATSSAVAITLVDYLLLSSVTIPRGVIFIDWGATLLTLGAVRAMPRAVRYARTRFGSRNSLETTAVIVGANDEGEALLRALRNSASMSYRIVGFVDDNPSYRGRRIGGVPVLGTLGEVPQVVKRHAVEEALIAGSTPGRQVRQLIAAASSGDFRVKVLPSYDQILGERVSVQPRSVAIEDLLRREAVDFDQHAVGRWLDGQIVLVTGSAGSIGSEICRQLLRVRPVEAGGGRPQRDGAVLPGTGAAPTGA